MEVPSEKQRVFLSDLRRAVVQQLRLEPQAPVATGHRGKREREKVEVSTSELGSASFWTFRGATPSLRAARDKVDT